MKTNLDGFFLISAFRGAIFFFFSPLKAVNFRSVQTPLASRGSCWAVGRRRIGDLVAGKVCAVRGLELLPLRGSYRARHAWVLGEPSPISDTLLLPK